MVRRPFINYPENLISEALEGLQIAYPQHLALNAEHHFITRKNKVKKKVGLISGGGSGHEPLHAGFVGEGMLDVAVAGAVFASPTALQILEGTKAADSGRGVVQIVKNYTGDVLNFRIAGEFADDLEIETGMVLVADDVASDSDTGPGRRGTGATVFVEKIMGAAAERGDSLEKTLKIGQEVADRARSMSLALEAGTHPNQKQPQFDLQDHEVELGVGIHGERASQRTKYSTADQLIEELLKPLIEHMGLKKKDELMVLVNGLGGTYPLELQVANRAVHRYLADQKMTVTRTLMGSYVTSLNMHGVSVSLLPSDQTILELWDAPVNTPALRW